ncbi:MAG TPA: dihydroorotase [Thermomicrobiales bacterium]|nr:dihydroorotase [Thermomicrobiales bacterium]
MTSLRIDHAHLIDPSNNLDGVGFLYIEDGKIAEISPAPIERTADRVIDGTDLIVTPGWIDMHVHLRVPGQEFKETIATGTRAAAAGGFTAIACMPNTVPALDNVEVITELLQNCARDGVVPVLPIAAITKGRAGKELVDFDALDAIGVVGFSDDGISTADASLMMDALRASARLGKPIMVHCEDATLVGGVMHEGEVSRTLGLKGIPAAAEESFIARDCLLAGETGGWLHVLHVSSALGLGIINFFRDQGFDITNEVMPHHLVMTDEWVAGDRTLQNTDLSGPRAAAGHPDTKVNPPLRTATDTRALLAGLAHGHFDILGTDHAPHAASEKRDVPIQGAAFGMIGLEVAVPTMLALVRAGHLTLSQIVDRFACQPARLWGLPHGRLEPEGRATLTVINPDLAWTVTESELQTKSKNTPLLGMTMTGRAVLTMIDGKVVHDLLS